MKFSQCVYSPHCFKVYSSFEIYHSHDNGITRNHGITMLDQTDRMSAASNWQMYHFTRVQKRKSEGQKCNIYNAVSRWMHTKHLLSRLLKSLSEECLQHRREVLLSILRQFPVYMKTEPSISQYIPQKQQKILRYTLTIPI